MSAPELGATPPGAEEAAPEVETVFNYTDLVATFESIGKERKWAVEGAFENAPLVVWTAPEKGGKTWAAIDLCVALVTGEKWLGAFQARAKGPPLYLDGEVGDYDFARRAARIARGRGHPPREVLGRIKHLSSPGFYLHRESEFFLPVLNDATALHPSVIIIDPWRNHLLGDENSARDTIDAMTAAAALRDRAGAPVIILHHLNKAGGMSGSRALRTRADLILVGTDEAEPHYSAVGRTVRAGDAIARPFTIVVQHEDDDDDRIAKTVVRARFEGESSARSDLSKPAARLLAELQTRTSPASANDLGKAVGVNNGTVRSRALKELLDGGRVTLKAGKWAVATKEFFDALDPEQVGQ